MRINGNYRLDYDLDDICIQKRENGTWRELCSISDTAAMVWSGIERGLGREEIVAAIVNEFDGADEAMVDKDMDALLEQLGALGILED